MVPLSPSRRNGEPDLTLPWASLRAKQELTYFCESFIEEYEEELSEVVMEVEDLSKLNLTVDSSLHVTTLYVRIARRCHKLAACSSSRFFDIGFT